MQYGLISTMNVNRLEELPKPKCIKSLKMELFDPIEPVPITPLKENSCSFGEHP